MAGSKKKDISLSDEFNSSTSNNELEKSQQKPLAKDNQDKSSSTEIADFLAKAKDIKPVANEGRFIFAMDATMSRQPTWDLAISLQGDMFRVVENISGLSVQLVYFRGLLECKTSKWVNEPKKLAKLMSTVQCRAGRTNLKKILKHTLRETKKHKVSAVVFIGDALEENIDELAHMAGELKIFGVPLFMFQEGHDPLVRSAFEELARISGGAYRQFTTSAANELSDLLKAVAAFVSAGKKGLSDLAKLGNQAATGLLDQLDAPKK